MLSTANITIQFGSKPLFENISVKFGKGNRYGLIGANGCGKSTLMKILGGELAPTSGNVSCDDNKRIGKLNQNQFAFEEFSVIDTVIMGHNELWQIKQERDQIYAKPDMSEADGMRAAELESNFAELDGYTAESRAGELLLGVNIPIHQHYGPMSAVAPGWKLRVLLIQALFADPDILLLDEPTNNLDIDTIRWLEEVLNERDGTMIVISHDRHFLNSVCTNIADLDYGELRVYSGNYDEYMLASTQARARMVSDNEKKKAQIADLQTFVSRFSANASKAKQATSRARQIEKIQLDEIKPSSRMNPYIRFSQEKVLHRLALELENLSLGYDEKLLLNKLNCIIEVGERVAIIGNNGVGKTTLLRKIVNDNALKKDLITDKGIVKWSENVHWGYYEQDNTNQFEAEMTLLEWMTQWRQPNDDEQAVRGILGRLLFSQDDINKSVKIISGGEKGRMMFGKFMMQKPNVLIMDEPTNHLDMESIESLNMALESYTGTLIFVSHDRQFVSSLATRILEIRDDGINDFKGNYEDYLSRQ